MHQVPENGGLSCPYCGREPMEPPHEYRLYGRFFMPSDLTACHCEQCGRTVSRFTRSGLVTNGVMGMASTATAAILLYHAVNMIHAELSGEPTLSRLLFAGALLVLALPFAAYVRATIRVLMDTLYHGISQSVPSRPSRWELLRGVLFSTLFILLALSVIFLSDHFDIHISGFVELLTGSLFLLTLMTARYFDTRMRVTNSLLLVWLAVFLLAAALLTDRHHPLSMTLRDISWRFEGGDGPAPGLLMTEDDHWGPVNAVAVSPNGRILASASQDGTIKLWSAKDFTLYATFQCDNPARDVQFSNDGQTLAGRTDAGDIFLWDVLRSTQLTKLKGTEYSAMAFQPGTDSLLTVRDKSMALHPLPYTVARWNADAPYAVRDVRFSRDGRSLMASFIDDDERGLAVWRIRDGNPEGSPEFIGGRIRAFAPLGDDLVVMVGRTSGSPLLLWARESGTMLGELGLTTGFVDTIATAPRHRLLSIGGENVTPAIWDGSTGLSVQMTGHKGSVRGVAFMPDGQRMVTGDDSGAVRIWNIQEIFRRK